MQILYVLCVALSCIVCWVVAVCVRMLLIAVLISSSACDDSPDRHLPIAQTCASLIRIPEYSSSDQMRQKLIYAMDNTPNMDADRNEANAAAYEDFLSPR